MRRTLLAFGALAVALTTAQPAPAADPAKPVRLLIITGDNVAGHKWAETTAMLRQILAEKSSGRIQVDVTETPGKDLTPENLAKYDALLLHYFATPKGGPDTVWSDANKQAFLDAVKGGKGLVVHHFGSAAFAKPTNWEEFEKAVAGGWRAQGYHGPPHEFTVKTTAVDHPISRGLPASFDHKTDELYSNSVMVPGNVILATAYSDPAKPRGTGKDEPVVWVNQYGEGRVYENVLGHDLTALSDQVYQAWLTRGAIWAATGEVDPQIQ